jgi:Cu/Ag efflux pump CusA
VNWIFTSDRPKTEIVRVTLAFGMPASCTSSGSFQQLNIEAYPDPVPPLVDVITQNPGQSAEEIERRLSTRCSASW